MRRTKDCLFLGAAGGDQSKYGKAWHRTFMTFIVLLGAMLAVYGSEDLEPPPALVVSITELTSHPELHRGKRIQTTGIWLNAFETSALSDSMIQRGGAPRLKEPLLWLEGTTVTDKRDCVSHGFRLTFCTVDVDGIFEDGGGFGHLGQYQFQIKVLPKDPQASQRTPAGSHRYEAVPNPAGTR